jgi:hypothetical protein
VARRVSSSAGASRGADLFGCRLLVLGAGMLTRGVGGPAGSISRSATAGSAGSSSPGRAERQTVSRDPPPAILAAVRRSREERQPLGGWVTVTTVACAVVVALTGMVVVWDNHVGRQQAAAQALQDAARADRRKPYNDFMAAIRAYYRPPPPSWPHGGVILANRRIAAVIAAAQPIYIYGSLAAMDVADTIVEQFKYYYAVVNCDCRPMLSSWDSLFDAVPAFATVMCQELAARPQSSTAQDCSRPRDFVDLMNS